MEKNQNYHNAIDRLLKLPLIFGTDYEYYHAHFKEYCRRMILREQELSLENEWPLFNIPAHFDIEYKERKKYNDLYLFLKENKLRLSPFSNSIMQWYVHFESIKEWPEVKNIDLPHPYEPIIRILEKGGYIHKEHGFYQINSGMFRLQEKEYFMIEKPFVENLVP